MHRAALILVLAAGLAAVPAAAAQQTASADTTLQALVRELHTCTITEEGARRLLRVIAEEPERVEALGVDLSPAPCPPAHVRPADAARTYAARALDELEYGDDVLGDSLFALALETAASDRQRADFLASRAAAELGDVRALTDRALGYDPWHGPSLLRRADLLAQQIGRPSTLRARFAYWCLADEYRRVAVVAGDAHTAQRARAAADRYDRLGPGDALRDALGALKPGETVTAPFGEGRTCTTVVR